MRLLENSTEQKLYGVYYTPEKIVDALVKYIGDDPSIKTILEPSCGSGRFIMSLLSSPLKDREIYGIDIDSSAISELKKKVVGNNNVIIDEIDYFEYYYQNSIQKTVDSDFSSKMIGFDLIVGNPPYIRYQYLTSEQRELLSKIISSNGMKPNKLINAWVGFLVSCINLLSENGKILFVIPAELLQVAFAEELRLFLSKKLSKITLITFETLVFPEIEQEVLLFIGEKGEKQFGIRTIEISNADMLDSIDFTNIEFQEIEHNTDKWTKYFTTADEAKLIHSIRNDNRFRKFSDCGVINVGITTGNNKYFSVEKEIVEKYNLADITLPLIGRSSHSHGLFFTKEDWLKNVDEGKKAQLVCFPEIPFSDYPEGHKRYIEFGSGLKENHGYKCSIRDRWYIVPSVWIPDAFFLRRNNLYPKFVLNACNGVSTDTMHRIKFNSDLNPEKILLSYYNSISLAFSEICGRSYGGGVLEILPGEVGNILLPNIDNMDISLCESLLCKVDKMIRNNDDIEDILDFVDSMVLVNYLGISQEICDTFRNIWKKYQSRRLKRGNKTLRRIN